MEQRIYTVATAHLDTVWRWNLATTIQDYLSDTVSKNFYLMQKIPHYKFNFEGAFRYELIEEYYPDFFEQIQDYVRHGQWQPAGSSYENGDVNIPSPEALFRNILIGNTYFEEKFGKRTRDIFLPDCFGFGLALPTVMKHANLKGFITQKLSWGCAYGSPFDIGRWKGVDSSTVFACTDARSYRYKFSNVRTDANVTEKLGEHLKNGILPWTLQFHGDGDVGGAPEISSAKAVSDAVNTNDLNDKQVIAAAADQIFYDLEALSAEEQERLPLCETELLMTNHGVGAYTSRTMSKRLNRKSEMLADMTERSCVAAEYISDFRYPAEPLTQAWKRVLEHQFHDDLTGTSIMEVYNRSWNDYFKSLNQFQSEFAASAHAVAQMLDTSFVTGTALIVNNAVCAPRTDCVRATVRMNENAPYVKVFDKDANEVPSQVLSKRGKTFEIVFLARVPSLSYTVFDVRPSLTKCTLSSDLKVTLHTLENEKYAVVLNKNGDIGSIVDKKLKRQLLKAPVKLALLRDVGALEYPSWELRKSDLDKAPYAYANTPEFEIVESGPASAALKITRTANGSTFTQIVSLTAGGEAIRVDNEIEWQSRRTLLKAQFPFTCENDKASYDLGLGVIERTTNTEELYEVPAQKWADITDRSREFGVTVLSDSKYGWDKPDSGTLRLTCIHTPTGAFIKQARQDLQDIGLNRFAFGIYSHSGGYTTGSQLAGECFGTPLTAFQTSFRHKGRCSAQWSFAQIDNSDVLVRAVKKAERSDEIVVRFNEGSGKKGQHVVFSMGDGIESAREIYASEEPMAEAKTEDGKLVFDIDRYSVKSFALTLKKAADTPTSTAQCIPLKPEYNVDVVTSNYNRQLTIMAASGTSLPRELFPQRSTCTGIPYEFASEKEQYNALIPRGQTVKLPKDTTNLYFLACSVRGDREVEFTVGDQKKRTLVIHDFMEPIGQWDMYAMGQTANIKNDAVIGYEFTHTHSPQDDNFAQGCLFFQYVLPVKGAQTVTLPDNNAIVILAMTAVKQADDTKLATPLIDTVESRTFVDTSDRFDKTVDKLDALTIHGGRIADQIKGGKGKGVKRNNIITNVIRSFTKKEW